MDIGSGHVMRCMALADQLRQTGAEVAFVCAEHVGAMFELVRSRGYRCAVIASTCNDADWMANDADMTLAAVRRFFPDGLDWLVVDHYSLDKAWERQLRPYVGRIMVIDDLADRAHDCDLLLDQNFYRDQAGRYQGLVPDGCVTLLGPGYVLMRQEFIEARRQLRNRDGRVRRLLVFFGGADPLNLTKMILHMLQQWGRQDIMADVVVGAANPSRNEIQALCNSMSNVVFHCQISNMAELIANADIGIGSGGSAMWERCYLGLPTITVVMAANQARTTEDVSTLGAIVYLGKSEELRAEDYRRALEALIENPEQIRQLSESALSLIRPCDIPVAAAMWLYACR